MRTNSARAAVIFSVFLAGVFVSTGCNSQSPNIGSTTSSQQENPNSDHATSSKNQSLIALDKLLAWDGNDNSAQKLDITQATIESLADLATAGKPQAAFVLARMYRLGYHVDQSDSKSVEYLKMAAEQGHAVAQSNLGLCYEDGTGVKKDLVEAVKWYRKSAEQGDAVGQFLLGLCYYNGTGVAKDLVEAVKWYRKSAEQGHAVSQNNLGVCYKLGTVVDKDLVEAVKWYSKAAEQGLALAQNSLGLCYKDGIGVEKNPTEAAKWYRKASIQGNSHAQYNLALLCAKGVGVDKNPIEAAKWYRKAADQGLVEAQINLGTCYFNGTGVLQDRERARHWFRKAASQGNKMALRNLNSLNRSLGYRHENVSDCVRLVAKQQERETAQRKVDDSKVPYKFPENTIVSQQKKQTLNTKEESILAEAYESYRAGEAGQSEKLLAELQGKHSVPAVAALDIRLEFIQQLNQEAAKAMEFLKADDDKSFKEVFSSFAKQQDNELLEAWKSQPLSAELCEMVGECFNDIALLTLKHCKDKQASKDARSKAMACFRKCIQIDKQNGIAHLRLAAIYGKENGRSPEVLEHLIAALEGSPEQGLGLSLLCHVITYDAVPDEFQAARLQAALSKLTNAGQAALVETHREVAKDYREQEKLARRIEALQPGSHPEVWQSVRRHQYVSTFLKNALESKQND